MYSTGLAARYEQPQYRGQLSATEPRLALATNHASTPVREDIGSEIVDEKACFVWTDNDPRDRFIQVRYLCRRWTLSLRYRRGGGTPALQGYSPTEWNHSKPIVLGQLTNLLVAWVGPSVRQTYTLDTGF